MMMIGTRARSHWQSLAHARAQSLEYTRAQSLAHAREQSLANTHAQSLAHARAQSLVDTRAQSFWDWPTPAPKTKTTMNEWVAQLGSTG